MNIMKDWVLRLFALLTSHFGDAAQEVWDELPSHVTAAVIIEAAASGDPAWIGSAVLLLVTLAILRR